MYLLQLCLQAARHLPGPPCLQTSTRVTAGCVMTGLSRTGTREGRWGSGSRKRKPQMLEGRAGGSFSRVIACQDLSSTSYPSDLNAEEGPNSA